MLLLSCFFSLTLSPSPQERDLSGTTEIASSNSAANSLSFGEGWGEAKNKNPL